MGRNEPWGAVPGQEEWPPRVAAVRTRLQRMVYAPAADPAAFFPHKNFISHFLVVLLIIAGFANNGPFNLPQPSVLYKGSVTLLPTTYSNSAISLRPITAQSDALCAGPKGACLHESHCEAADAAKAAALLSLTSKTVAQRGGGIPRGFS